MAWVRTKPNWTDGTSSAPLVCSVSKPVVALLAPDVVVVAALEGGRLHPAVRLVAVGTGGVTVARVAVRAEVGDHDLAGGVAGALAGRPGRVDDRLAVARRASGPLGVRAGRRCRARCRSSRCSPSPRTSVRCAVKPRESLLGVDLVGARRPGALSLKTSMRSVVRGSGVGFSVDRRPAACPPSTVKCAPSILKPSEVTEIRYLPAGRLSSALLVRQVGLVALRDDRRVAGGDADRRPRAGVGVVGVARAAGPGAAPAGSSRCPGWPAVPGSPVSSSLMIHLYFGTASPLWTKPGPAFDRARALHAAG